MQIDKIHTNHFRNRNKNLNRNIKFGLKIDRSANSAFRKINDFLNDNNLNVIAGAESTRFAKEMGEIREFLKNSGIIKRKGGIGLCISIPDVLKRTQSKKEELDTLIDCLHTPNQYSLIRLKSQLKKIETEFLRDKKTYFEIHGKEYTAPKQFIEN